MDGGLTAAAPPLSFSGRRWVARACDTRAAALIAQAHGLPEPLARLIAVRGIAPADLDRHLTPRLRDWLPDPSVLPGMDRLAERLADAVRRGETVAVFGDYDVDGAAATALMRRFLEAVGGRAVHAVPDRLRDGYGPNVTAFRALADAGAQVILCVDCGSAAPDPIADIAPRANVLVLDHHRVEAAPVAALAHVNPTLDTASGLDHLCAAGLAFLAAVATNRVLREAGWPRTLDAGGLLDLVDLVAIAAVADVVRLTGVNRAFVYRGLPLLTARGRPGIKALAAAAGIDPLAPITEKECGWVLGPRINAGGRIGQSDSGALLLLEEDPEKATARAEALHALNTERRQLEAATTEAAIEQLADRRPGVDRGLALAVVEDAHEGVVGISAARLREAYDAPAIVLSRAHDGALKGSARSVPGFDIGHAIIAARQAGILVKGGGHGMAGGLTIEESRLAEFVAFMDGEIGKTEYARIGVVSQADARLTLAEFTVAGLRGMDRMRPFGTANEEPRIVLAGAVLQDIRVLKEIHFKLVLEDRGVTVDALMWNAANLPIAREIREAIGSRVDVYGTGSINAFRGKETPQIVISDIRLTPGVLL